MRVSARCSTAAAFLCATISGPAAAQVAGGQVVPNARAVVMAACSTTNVKVVFQMHQNLYYVDFNESEPQIHRFKNESQTGGDAFMPVISNDGKWVTYAKGVNGDGEVDLPMVSSAWAMELDSAGTPLKVADVGFVPRFVQNPAAGGVEVVYATDASCESKIGGQTHCEILGQTLKRRITTSSRALGAVQTVCATGSYYGGLSYDNNYLCTGWTGSAFDPLMADLRIPTAAPKHMHTMAVKKNVSNRDTVVTIRSCNPSRSASRVFTDAMMFFDFSSNQIIAESAYHPILTAGWGTHQVIFVSRYGTGTYGTDMRYYEMPTDLGIDPAPTGTGTLANAAWQHPEWSTHPYFGVASVYVNRLYKRAVSSYMRSSRNEFIYIIDLRTGQSTRIIEITPNPDSSNYFSVQNPFLYVDVPSNFQEDPTWLSTTHLQLSARSRVSHSRSISGIVMDRGIIRSPRTITYLSLLDAAGRTIASTRFAGRSVSLQDAFGRVRCGIHFVRVENDLAQTAVLKWVVQSDPD